jgi:Tfp pilus assembly protein PilE
MTSKPTYGSSQKVKAIIYIIIAALILAIAYSAYTQLTRSSENRDIEAGLIEAGDKPTIYFNLKNTDAKTHNYTYLITTNSTENTVIDKGLILNIHPNQTFHYTLILTREEQTKLVMLTIYLGEEAKGQPLYNQTWLIKPRTTHKPS